MWFLIPPALIIIPEFLKVVRKSREEHQEVNNICKAYQSCDEALAGYTDEELLYDGERTRTCPSGGCQIPVSQWYRSFDCPECTDGNPDRDLEALYRQLTRPGLHNELTEEEILFAPSEIWVEGQKLQPLNHESLARFMEIKNRAYLKEDYNSIPLGDGGYENLLIDWFRLLGVSDTMAERLVDQGMLPWEFNPNWGWIESTL